MTGRKRRQGNSGRGENREPEIGLAGSDVFLTEVNEDSSGEGTVPTVPSPGPKRVTYFLPSFMRFS
jgi:hypothetical protein